VAATRLGAQLQDRSRLRAIMKNGLFHKAPRAH
jgi:hypothetical protein